MMLHVVKDNLNYVKKNYHVGEYKIFMFIVLFLE